MLIELSFKTSFRNFPKTLNRSEMEMHRQVMCSENESLAAFMWNRRKELDEGPKGVSENIDFTLSKAYSNLCNSKTPIKTLKDFAKIKGVGNWILTLMKGFFDTDSGAPENEEMKKKGKRNKAANRYLPQKNSVAYALLITLYRGTVNGIDFMGKQELIDAAEASGLSAVPIMPEMGNGKPCRFGSSPRDFYSGWSGMKILINKGLAVKSSCPAKYKLSEEGKEAARECLKRSGLVDSIEGLATVERTSNLHQTNMSNDLVEEVTLQYVDSSRWRKSVDVPSESFDRFFHKEYSKEQIIRASKASSNKEISSLWPSVLCRLREDQIYGLHLESQNVRRERFFAPSSSYKHRDGQVDLLTSESKLVTPASEGASDIPKSSNFMDPTHRSSILRACSSTDYEVLKRKRDGLEAKSNFLAMPPLTFGERFGDAYKVVLVLDDREKFATQRSRIIEHIRTQFKISIEVRRLPVGDGIWIARHKHLDSEYVLDFIVERKNVDDLRCSIRDNRYRDQKVRLLRCGLKKMIYLVEGDPNASQAAESIKTACFTTEILEGFDVQRTSGLADTLRKYGYLTQAITQYYRSPDAEDKQKSAPVCPPFDEFIKRCQDLEKMTAGDVFAIQLMQVQQVTEEVAIAVLDLYPTLLSLARAYSLLDGEIRAQEEMLMKQSNVISGVASRNIFQLVWGS